MRRILLLLTLFLSFINIATAQAPKEKTLLWEVTGNGIKQPSYLFGTIHLMCPADIKVAPIIKDKFNATKELFLEVDLDDPNVMKEMMANMLMNDTITMKGLLGDNKYDSLKTIFKKTTGISIDMFGNMKPMFLMSLIYPSLLGCEPDSWEKTFEAMATKRKMEVKGLEDVSEQIKVFEKIPYKVQADMLANMLLNIDSTRRTFTEILNVYKAKDLNRLYTMVTVDDDFGAYEEVLLNNRNNNWIPVIAKQARQMPTFFACGAGHLGGNEGVISLLKKAGFTVKPVMY